jgi:hypothetical protein
MFRRKAYQNPLKGDFKETIVQSILVNYSTESDDIKKYRTYAKLRFDVNDFLDVGKGGSELGLWDMIEADFK